MASRNRCRAGLPRCPNAGRGKAPARAKAFGSAVVVSRSCLARFVRRLLRPRSCRFHLPASANGRRNAEGRPFDCMKNGPPSAFRAGFFDLATPEPLRDPMAADASHPRPDLPSPSHGNGLGCLRTLKRTDPQTPHSRRRAGGAARPSGTPPLRKGKRRRRRPPGSSPKRSPQGPRTIPAIVRPVRWAGGEGMMGDGCGGGDFFSKESLILPR